MGAVRTLVDELRRRGATVHEWSGWDGRGNSGVPQISPVGAVIHHTGSAYGNGYAELVSSSQAWADGGCLCNFSGNADGSFTVIASGLAYHAGPGAGPSLGPLAAVRNNMNGRTVGLEIVYPGSKPMTDAQYRSALLFGRIVADLFGGGDIECIRAHAETNGDAPGGDGKWDPGFADGKTIDMAAFRRDAATMTGDDIVTPQEMEAVADLTVEKLKTALVHFSWRDPNNPASRIDDSVQFWAMWAQLYPTMFHGGGFNTAWGPGVMPRLMAIEEAVAKVAEANGLNREQFLADIREAAKQGAAEGESLDNADEAAAVLREMATRLAIDPITGKQNGAVSS